MSYKSLTSSHLGQGVTYHKPDHARYENLTLENPALDVMTDLKKVTAFTIHPGEKIDTADKKMKDKAVRMLFVVDAHDDIQGVITSGDILGEKPMKYIQQNGGTHAEIEVSDIMCPASRIETLTIKEVSHAKVGDIIETLKHLGRQHALVVDNQGSGNKMTLRGIFSLSNIARQLGVKIQNHEVASTLADIAHVINQSHS